MVWKGETCRKKRSKLLSFPYHPQKIMTQCCKNRFKLCVLLHIMYSFYLNSLRLLHRFICVCMYAYECVNSNRSFLIRTYKRLSTCVDVLRRWWSCSYQAWYKIPFTPKQYEVRSYTLYCRYDVTYTHDHTTDQRS